jgi:hypothetical protein
VCIVAFMLCGTLTGPTEVTAAPATTASASAVPVPTAEQLAKMEMLKSKEVQAEATLKKVNDAVNPVLKVCTIAWVAVRCDYHVNVCSKAINASCTLITSEQVPSPV